MDAPDSDFRRLIERFQAGDAAAGAELMERYGGVVREAVRRRLPDRLRREYDSIDFVQDVWTSFCTQPPEGERFDTPAALAGYLARMANYKVIDACRRRFGTEGFDVRREQEYKSVAARGETASQVAIVEERWEQMTRRLPPVLVKVARLLAAGHTQAEIAAIIGVNERHVRRLLDQLHELCEDDS